MSRTQAPLEKRNNGEYGLTRNNRSRLEYHPDDVHENEVLWQLVEMDKRLNPFTFGEKLPIEQLPGKAWFLD